MKTNEHKHNFYLDTEIIPTNNDKYFQTRSIFLECLDCNFIKRDNEIIKYIESLIELSK